MQWYGWALVIYIALDRFFAVALCGRGYKISITPMFAVVSLITGALIVWAIISLGMS